MSHFFSNLLGEQPTLQSTNCRATILMHDQTTPM